MEEVNKVGSRVALKVGWAGWVGPEDTGLVGWKISVGLIFGR
jgi:hypothetical protein